MLSRLIAMVTTPFSQQAYTQLLGVLAELKDDQAVEHSGGVGRTLVWDDETGKVLLTVRRFPFLSVNVTVKTPPLWMEYMEDRDRNGIRNRFYFDDFEDVFEFRVQNVADLICAANEMHYLNWVRLNWFRLKTERRMALAMGKHSRLGAGSQLAQMHDNVLQVIGLLI